MVVNAMRLWGLSFDGRGVKSRSDVAMTNANPVGCCSVRQPLIFESKSNWALGDGPG